MTVNEYLRNIIDREKNVNTWSDNENSVFNEIKSSINQWFTNKYIGYPNTASALCGCPSIEVQQSGSRMKGTSLKGKSDLDIFISITDKNNSHTTKEYFYDILEYAKEKFNVWRKQTVSVGIEYKGCDIDLVPATKINSYMYDQQDNHYLYDSGHDKIFQTNIRKQISYVKSSNRQDLIILLKTWRRNHSLEFPSVVIEYFCIETLKDYHYNDLEDSFKGMLEQISKYFLNKRLVDVSNTNNIISDILNDSQKQTVINCANSSLEQWKKWQNGDNGSWDKIIK